MAAEADKLRANQKAAKELKIRKKYEAELAALNAECSSPVPEPLSSPQSDTTPDRFMSQLCQQIPRLAIPTELVFSDSNSDQESHCSANSHSVKSYSAQPKRPTMFPSPAPRQSECSRESTKKVELQSGRTIKGPKGGKSVSQNSRLRRSCFNLTLTFLHDVKIRELSVQFCLEFRCPSPVFHLAAVRSSDMAPSRA